LWKVYRQVIALLFAHNVPMLSTARAIKNVKTSHRGYSQKVPREVNLKSFFSFINAILYILASDAEQKSFNGNTNGM
tara:strand:- start:1648 stop:1878 length:231 start_codon:yes stop_codon:yes gene_type:complete